MIEGLPVLGAYWGGHTELAEVSGADIGNVPDLPKCRVQVLKKYQINQSIGYRFWSIFGGRTELSKVSVPVSNSYRTLRYGSVGCLLSKYPRYAMVLTLSNIPLEFISRQKKAFRNHPRVLGFCVSRVPAACPAGSDMIVTTTCTSS